MIHSRFVLAVFLWGGVAVGCGSAASATPTVTITSLGLVDRALDAGTYKVDLAKAPTVRNGESRYRALLITVPNGWNNLDGWAIHRGGLGEPTVAAQFWDVDQVYGRPCQWKGTLFRPGPTVDDLAMALVDRPLRNATQPVDVTLDGYAGKYLEWSVPADINFSACDVDGGKHHFESWTGNGQATDRYQQGPGQVDRLWILDVNGARLVIDGFSMPSATSAERQELLHVVESITFER